MSLSMALAAVALVSVLVSSSRFRRIFAGHMPGRTGEWLNALSSALWMLAALLLVASAGRMALALTGPSSFLSSALAGVASGLALLSAWTMARASWRLRRGT